MKNAQKVIKVDAKERSSVTTAKEVMEQESGTVQFVNLFERLTSRQ